jgi:hypothetical protein
MRYSHVSVVLLCFAGRNHNGQGKDPRTAEQAALRPRCAGRRAQEGAQSGRGMDVRSMRVAACCFIWTVACPVQLRVAQVTNGAASKLAKIKLVRKNIARVLTVLNQCVFPASPALGVFVVTLLGSSPIPIRCRKVMAGLRKSVADLKHKPKQLREKKTRALRRALTKHQVSPLT